MKDLKEKTIRGGAARMLAQIATFVFRVGSVMIVARLVDPHDTGLVQMVTAFTGVLNLFRDFGLSTATVQREHVTDGQISTLFWINVAVGTLLAGIAVAFSPLVVRFYHEPRLAGIMMVLSAGFIFNAMGVQHSALLQRALRFTELAVINVSAIVVSIIVAIGLAKMGYGYWALVAQTVTLPLTTTIGVWIAANWRPGLPRRRAGVLGMLKFGGTLTLNGLVVYIGYNLDKVLLGRYWGAEDLGLYGRSFQLISIPTDNLNQSVGEVAFSALSRVQTDRPRLRNYFLKGYSLVLGMTIPITLLCACFASDIIHVVLGPKWNSAIPIFRLLAPTILIFAMINPLAWLMFALGMVGRSLRVALVLAPVVMCGYLFGIHYWAVIGMHNGPEGAAFGYSTIMLLWVIPHIAWCVKDTGVSLSDILLSVSRPLTSGLLACGIAIPVHMSCVPHMGALPRLVIAGIILLAVYFGMQCYVMGQKALYMDVLNGFRKRTGVDENVLVPA
jgi:O-antigen/teichoic acid export membrane protein